jgi:hypothetical protein
MHPEVTLLVLAHSTDQHTSSPAKVGEKFTARTFTNLAGHGAPSTDAGRVKDTVT